MKRITVFLLLLSFIVPASLFAAGGRQDTGGPITVTFWTHEDPNRTRIEERYIREFESVNPNVRVERTTQASTRLIELIQTAFAANQGPDIFNLSIEDQYAYIVNQRVAPINYQAAGYRNRAHLYEVYDQVFLDPVTVDGNIIIIRIEKAASIGIGR